MKTIIVPGVVAAAVIAAVGECRAQESMYVLTHPLVPQLHELDPQTGAMLSFVPVFGHQSLFGGLAVDAAENLYSIDGFNDEFDDRTFRIDIATGAGTVVGPTGFNWNFRTVVVNPVDDVLYGASDNPIGGVYTINKTTGVATHVAGFSGSTQLDQMTAMAINAQGQAFITDIQDTSLFSVNLQTGVLTFIGNIGGSGDWFTDLAFDAAGVLWGPRQNGGVYTIDTTTAVPTFRFNGAYTGIVFVGGAPPCYPDCNAVGGLTIADFACFQTRFVAGDPYADCNGVGGLTIADFACFQTAFVQGCP